MIETDARMVKKSYNLPIFSDLLYPLYPHCFLLIGYNRNNNKSDCTIKILNLKDALFYDEASFISFVFDKK